MNIVIYKLSRQSSYNVINYISIKPLKKKKLERVYYEGMEFIVDIYNEQDKKGKFHKQVTQEFNKVHTDKGLLSGFKKS